MDQATLTTKSRESRDSKPKASAAERKAKRRQRWTILPGTKPVEVAELGGSAALVEASAGGVHVEFGTDSGIFYSVPVESVVALGFALPEAKPKPRKRASK